MAMTEQKRISAETFLDSGILWQSFELERFLETALAKITEMVADGRMPEAQAQGMRGNVGAVRARHAGLGPPDWLDAHMDSVERNISTSQTLAPEEQEQLLAEMRDPQYRAALRLYGPPGWASIKTMGQEGVFFADAMTPEELEFARERERNARSAATELFAEKFGEELAAYIETPSQNDANSALFGAQGLDVCEKWERAPESFTSFLDAMQLQALSVGGLAHRDRMVTLLGDDCATKANQSYVLWAKNGFPFVHIRNAAWCANLCATSVHPEFADVIRAPWSSFRVAIPQGLLSIESDDGSGGNEDCTRLMAMYDDRAEWTIVLYGKTKMMHLTGYQTSMLCEDVPVNKANIAHDPGLRLTHRDGRAMRLASRLLLAICISMEQDGAVQSTRKRLRHSHRGAPEPIVRQYLLRPPVRINVDARPAIRAYMNGGRGGSAPSVQILVRGHWKRQPCGPRGAERKFIHIEPYWRGPEDAPIAVRPHILKGQATP